MSIDTLHITARRAGLVEHDVTKEQARELVVKDVASIFSGNKYIEDDLVLESLWWSASDEGLGPEGLQQYFGLSEIDTPNPAGKFTGEKPSNEMLLTQLVSIYDQWSSVKSRKEMDGLQGQLVVVPNDYIASRVVPLRNGTIQDKRVIKDEMGPIGNHWIVIDEKTNETMTGILDKRQSARISTPGTVAGPNPIYNELERSRVDNGGFGNYELQMVVTSSLDVGQVHEYIGNDSSSVRTVFATLFDSDALSKMAREKDGGIHRMVLGSHGGVEKIGVNIAGDTVKFSLWDIRGNDNRNKCIAAIGAKLDTYSNRGVTTRSVGRSAVGGSSKKRSPNVEDTRKKIDRYWAEKNGIPNHSDEDIKLGRKGRFHKERFSRPGTRGAVLPK